MVGRKDYLTGRHDPPRRVFLHASAVGLVRSLTLVGKGGVKNGKEGLVFPPVPVVCSAAALVPTDVLPTRTLPLDRHIVIGLRVVGAIVAGLPEDLRVVNYPPGHGHTATVIMDAKRRGIHSRDER